MALAALEPDDPDLAIPSGSLEIGMREASERTYLLDQSARLADTPLEPLGAVSKAAGPAERKRKWTVALVASCVFHAAVAMVFIPMSSDKVLIEGADASGIAFLGDAPEDQLSAGDIAEKDDPAVTNVTMITMVDAKPVATVDAQAVPVEETVEAVDRVEAETTAAESLQPVKDLPAELETISETVTATPPDRAEPVVDDAPSTVAAEIVPEILAVDTVKPAEDDDAVQRLAETVEAAPVETAETVTAQPEPVEEVSEAKPVRQTPPQPKKAVEKAERKPKPEKAKPQPKEATEKPAKKEKTAAKLGSGGQNQADARRGQADGQADGKTVAESKSGKNSAAGNAAVSNYPGKIVSKLRRALRYPAEAKRQKLRGEVQVSFVVSASGGVGSIRVVSSSGSPVLDKAAVETVRRAAPFPAIPGDTGRSSWPFTVPLVFKR